jgi:hypothetical protein
VFGDTEERMDYVRIELLSPTARDLGHGSLDGVTYACSGRTRQASRASGVGLVA